jgi:hypothetical protein
MTVLFLGGELDSLTPSDGGAIEDNEQPDRAWEPSFSRGHIEVQNIATYCDTPSWAGESELYIHFASPVNGTAGFGSPTKPYILALYDGSTEVFRLENTYNGDTTVTLKMYYLSALATWTQIGSSVTVAMNVLNHFDVYLKTGASGGAALYASGTERAMGSANISFFSNVTKARFNGSAINRISQIAVTTTPHIGARVATYYPNGAGASSQWVGTYAEVDELRYSDGDFINSGTADQVTTFAQTGPAPTGYNIRAVAVSTRAKRGVGGPQNLRHVLRVSGTNY